MTAADFPASAARRYDYQICFHQITQVGPRFVCSRVKFLGGKNWPRITYLPGEDQGTVLKECG